MSGDQIVPSANFSQRPVEPTEQCPNCGNWYRAGHCRFSSTASKHNGFLISTLYGVCWDCAERHRSYGDNQEASK